MKALAVLVAMTAVAHAETAQELTETARTIAREGQCDELPAIGRRVHLLDDDYFTMVYSIDPVIAGCKQVDKRPAPDPYASPKSPELALGLPLGLTLAGAGVVAVGINNRQIGLVYVGAIALVFGPETGHMYVGDLDSGGLAAGGIGAGVVVLGLLARQLECSDECHGDSQGGGNAIIMLGALIAAGGGLYQIATSPGSAHRYNREHGFEATVVPTGNGLAITGRF